MCTFWANFALDTATNGQTDIYKTRNVVNTYLNVTFEDDRSTAPTFAKIVFGKSNFQVELNV